MLSRAEILERMRYLSPAEQAAARELVSKLYGREVKQDSGRIPTIIEAIGDPNLLGTSFGDLKSWYRWTVFLKVFYGLPLDEGELAIFRHHTGRHEYLPPPGGYREAVMLVGVRSGKTRILSAVAVYESGIAYRGSAPDALYSILLAQDMRAAGRTLYNYASGMIARSQRLNGMLEEHTKTTLKFTNGIFVGAYPCNPDAIRGFTCPFVGIDEFAFYRGSDESQTDEEMLIAARGRGATLGGRLIISSSPGYEDGALFKLVTQHYGKDDASTLVWRATAPEMNPTLDPAYLARMEKEDPVAFRAEFLGEFRAGVMSAFDPLRIEECRAIGVHERPRRKGVPYYAFVDPSGGRVDSFGLAIGHDEEGVTVLDVVREWRAPFSPSSVVAEACDILREYGCSTVFGDKFGGEWPPEQFREHGVDYVPSDLDASALYVKFIATVNSRGVLLLDDDRLIRQLKGLQRRRASGREKVDHKPGEHDDVANCVAGVARVLSLMADPEVGLGRDPIVPVPRGHERPKPFAPDFGGMGDESEDDRMTLRRPQLYMR